MAGIDGRGRGGRTCGGAVVVGGGGARAGRGGRAARRRDRLGARAGPGRAGVTVDGPHRRPPGCGAGGRHRPRGGGGERENNGGREIELWRVFLFCFVSFRGAHDRLQQWLPREGASPRFEFFMHSMATFMLSAG